MLNICHLSAEEDAACRWIRLTPEAKRWPDINLGSPHAPLQVMTIHATPLSVFHAEEQQVDLNNWQSCLLGLRSVMLVHGLHKLNFPAAKINK